MTYHADGNRPGSAFLGCAFAFMAVMIGTTLPTPLYPIYQQRFGFSPLTITVIFAAYAVGVLGALLLMGSWSDQFGRRPMLIGGVVAAAAGAVTLLLSTAIPAFLIGRFICGISAGLFTGTGTIAVVELAPAAWRRHAALVATAANMMGLGSGPLIAGLLAEYAPSPLQLPYGVELGLLAAAGIVVMLMPETAKRPATPRLRIQRLLIPPDVREVFIPAAIAGFAGFALLGFVTASIPVFLAHVLGVSNHAEAGAVVFLLFLSSAAGQTVQGKLPQPMRLPFGCTVFAIGSLVIGSAIMLQSLTILIVGTIASGIGQGIVLRAGLGAIAERSPQDERAEVASTYFVVLYIAISLPVIGLGMSYVTLGLRLFGEVFSAIVAALALLAVALLRKRTSPSSA